MNQIFADDVTPVHGTPLRGVRMILIEKMILPFVSAKAVWIVKPAYRRGYVIKRIPAIISQIKVPP